MQDPYNYPFIQKGNTMYLSTISNNQLKFKLKTILQPELILIETLLSKKEISKVHFRRLLFLNS